MKKALSILLVVVMMASLFTACKKDENNQSSLNNTPTSSEQNTSGESIFDGNASSTESDTASTDSSATQSTNSSNNSSANSSSANTSTNKPSTNKPESNNSSTANNNTNNKPAGDNSSTQSSNKPSGNTSSNTSSNKPSTNTDTTPAMPSALKSLKGVEKFKNQPVDYSLTSSWISKPTATKDVDVFFLYPTGYTASDASVSDLSNSAMVQMATVSLIGQASVFSKECNIYMPKYRQLSINALLTYGNEENMIYMASFDLYNALDYYFENINNGRPFIIAGHSQGSVWASVILQDYMKKHPEYLKRMVAAYVIGYSITKDYLKRNTHLKFATGATDTGVIISYNTEGVGNKNAYNMVVEKGAVSINPINWKTDGTKASKSQNLGSLDHTTGKINTPGIADAQVDTTRGVVICTTVPKSMATPGFGPESYHTGDYSFYFANLMKNVADRIAAYKKK